MLFKWWQNFFGCILLKLSLCLKEKIIVLGFDNPLIFSFHSIPTKQTPLKSHFIVWLNLKPISWNIVRLFLHLDFISFWISQVFHYCLLRTISIWEDQFTMRLIQPFNFRFRMRKHWFNPLRAEKINSIQDDLFRHQLCIWLNLFSRVKMAVLGQINFFIPVVEEFLDPVFDFFGFFLLSPIHINLQNCDDDIKSAAQGSF